MENATKALLIAAGVLIVIVITTLAILLVNNSSDTTKQAQSVGEQMSLVGYQSLKEIKGTKQVPTQEIKTKMNNKVIEDLLSAKVRNKIYLTACFYRKWAVYSTADRTWSIYKDTCLKTIEGESKEERNRRIISQIFTSDDFIVVKDPYALKEQMESYLEKNDHSKPEGVKTYPSIGVYANYDSERIY